MYPEPFVPETRKASKKRRWGWRSSSDSDGPPETGLYLAAVGRSINVSDAVHRPTFAMLMTEDFCWQSSREEWRGRRPSWRRRRAYAAWRAEGAAIEKKKARIRQLAVELGLIT